MIHKYQLIFLHHFHPLLFLWWCVLSSSYVILYPLSSSFSSVTSRILFFNCCSYTFISIIWFISSYFCYNHHLSNILYRIFWEYLQFRSGGSFSPILILLYNKLIYIGSHYLYLFHYPVEFYLRRMSIYLLYHLIFHLYLHILDSSTVLRPYLTVGFSLSSLIYFWCCRL